MLRGGILINFHTPNSQELGKALIQLEKMGILTIHPPLVDSVNTIVDALGTKRTLLTNFEWSSKKWRERGEISSMFFKPFAFKEELYAVGNHNTHLAQIEAADFFSHLRPNYIYIWWNGLEVSKYAQSTPYIFIPSNVIPLGRRQEEGERRREVGGYWLSFPLWKNGGWKTSEMEMGDTWLSSARRGFLCEYFQYTENVHQALNKISGHEETRRGAESEDYNYRAYAIPIREIEEHTNTIITLNYSLIGINLNNKAQH
jgi:hypothetical protein